MKKTHLRTHGKLDKSIRMAIIITTHLDDDDTILGEELSQTSLNIGKRPGKASGEYMGMKRWERVQVLMLGWRMWEVVLSS